MFTFTKKGNRVGGREGRADREETESIENEKRGPERLTDTVQDKTEVLRGREELSVEECNPGSYRG